MALKISQETDPAPPVIAAIAEGLDSFNIPSAGEYRNQPLWLVVRDDDGVVQAGLKGRSFYKWLFVEWLWVAESFRGNGYGSRLLRQAESIAKERGCVGLYLDTYQFQAPKFYRKHGYQEFGRSENSPPGHARVYFSKSL